MEISSKFSTYDEVRTYSPAFAYEVGVNQAIFIRQLEYWLGNVKSGKIVAGRKWIRDTAEEWRTQLPHWSTRTIERIINRLVDKDILLIRKDLNKKGYDRTRWYTINFDKLNDMFDKSTLTPNFNQDDNLSNSNMTNSQNGKCQNGNMDYDKKSDTIPKHSSKHSTKHSPNNMSSSNEHDHFLKESHGVIDYLNKYANKQFRYSKSSIKFVKARLKEGYTSKDFKHVIDLKIYEWLNNEDMNKYLRPATLFNATKFESYLNEKLPFDNNKYSTDNAGGGIIANAREIEF